MIIIDDQHAALMRTVAEEVKGMDMDKTAVY
jgi:hypothetical protein